MGTNIDLQWKEDGYLMPDIREWSERKYRLIAVYNQLFSKGMKKYKRVYIDLFAGAGAGRYKENGQIVKGSPLLALDVEYKVDKYIFCEDDIKKADALEKRINEFYPAVNYKLFQGDCNYIIDEILQEISSTGYVLSFCFIDPYKLNSLKFNTIRALASKKRMDFLMLFHSSMEINIWRSVYLKVNYKVIEEFLGLKEWRKDWIDAKLGDKEFVRFIATKFGEQMININYLKNGLDEMVEIKMIEGNRSLYHLAFYSKHKLGYKFWKEAKKYGTQQLNLGI